MKLRNIAVTGIVMALLALPGCSWIRKVTYPPAFTYLEKSDITSSMMRMADSVRRIDSILISGDIPSDKQRQRIIEDLNTIDNMAIALGAGTQQSNHLLIDEHIDEFRLAVRRAKQDVENSPPRYYRVGGLIGNCTSCHLLR
ncbi:MAG: hypothetical protein OES26_07250 [Gammaproteobacteria bacterium]|nr:hypothetical protein [Gammaproteobacteria bacterium]